MLKICFDEAVTNILQRDDRYQRDAYAFVRDGLDFTMDRCRDNAEAERHVSGPELVIGLRDYALQQFGPMVLTVFGEWGIGEDCDFGEIVFNLIEEGVFGKQESDQRSDFCGVIDFDDAFRAPFLPKESSAFSPRKERVGTRADL